MFDSEMHKYCMKRKYHWFREPLWLDEDDIHAMPYEDLLTKKRPRFNVKEKNQCLNIQTKKAALKASSAVVSLLSYTGEQDLTQCCGVIVENDDRNGHIVLTSAKLIRCHTEEKELEDNLADSLKIIINLYGGQSYEGEVCTYDFHFNIAWIRFQSDSALPTARLRQVDDCINVNPAQDTLFQLRPHSSHFNLVPGHTIVAVGRYFAKPFDLMAAPGEFSIDRCDDFACKELFMATCYTTECGEGGPLVNLSGEVIGITFHETGFTPFLHMNIAQRCWEHFKRYGALKRPFLGIVATNLYTVDISLMEKVIHKIPGICNGVVVEKVIQGSSLKSVGLYVDDVVIECGGKIVRSFMEFLEMVWDKKVGDVLKRTVVRVCEDEPIRVNTVVDEVGVKNFYRWRRKWSL